jgi:hypothetical protein
MIRNHFGNIHHDNFFPAIRRVTLAAAMLSLAVPAVAVINTGTDAEAGLPYWEVVEHGVSIRSRQRKTSARLVYLQSHDSGIIPIKRTRMQ